MMTPPKKELSIWLKRAILALGFSIALGLFLLPLILLAQAKPRELVFLPQVKDVKIFLPIVKNVDGSVDRNSVAKKSARPKDTPPNEQKLVQYVNSSLNLTNLIHKQDQFVPGQVIIKFKPEVGKRVELNILSKGLSTTENLTLDNLLKKYKPKKITKLFQHGPSHPILEGIYLLKLPKEIDVQKVISDFNQIPDVIYVEPNGIGELEIIPNDTYYSEQWAHQNIQSETAWDIEKGDSNVILAILDTGVDWDHPDLAANIWVNRGWDFVDTQDPNCASEEDCTARDDNPMDFHGHGTHVAGIAAAVTNNNKGVAGVCWYCKIMAVRVAYTRTDGRGSWDFDDVAEGIKYAADNSARVINMSLGTSTNSSLISDAVDYAYENGVTIIAAAGNNNSDRKKYPAGYNNVIAVAATDQNDNRASFSNYGSWVDVAAPGTSIYSTLFDNDYGNKSGTSMASPHVAGEAGLILSQYPYLTNSGVKNIISNTTDGISTDKYIGTGRINLYKALTSRKGPWPMFQHDERHTGRSPLLGPETPSLKWSKSPGSNRSFYSPLVGFDGSVYIHFDGHGFEKDKIYALNSENGNIVNQWTIPEGSAEAYPAISKDGIIYIGTGSGKIYKIEDGILSEFFSSPTASFMNPLTIDDDGIVYAGSYRGALYAINPDGTLKWRYLEESEAFYYWTSPAVGWGKTIYITLYNRLLNRAYIAGLDPETGTEEWYHWVDNVEASSYVTSSPAVSPLTGDVYVGVRTKLYAFDAYGSGLVNPKWTFDTDPWLITSTPAIKPPDGTILFGGGKTEGVTDYGVLYALNLNGTLKWEYKIPNPQQALFQTPIIDGQGIIYVTTNENKLQAVKDQDNYAEKIWEFYSGGTPVIGIDKTIYLAYTSMLYAIGGGTANHPPTVPSDPNPPDGAEDVSIDADLSWTSSDPDPGDTLTYDVYFSPYFPPDLKEKDWPNNSYDSGTLEYDTTYYWQIYVSDGKDTVEGPIWSFTTTPGPITITVCQDGSCDYTTVSEGLNAARAGDTAKITDQKTYYGRINWPEDRDNITLDCDGATLTTTGSSAGINIDNSGYHTIKNCIVTGFLEGIQIADSNSNTIINNTIISNETGIDLNSDFNVISNNTISDNEVNGIWMVEGNSNSIINNVISNNGQSAAYDGYAGIYMRDADSNSVSDNTISNNGYGISFYYYGGSYESSNNTISNNIFCPSNIVEDFHNIENNPNNSGDENTCNKPDGWDDTGTAGCTYGCIGPPALDSLPNQSLDEDTSLNNVLDLWGYAFDPDNPDEELTFSIISSTDPNCGVSIDSDRYIDIVPTENWYGSCDATIRVTDPGELYDEQNLHVTVNPVNDPPQCPDVVLDKYMDEDTSLTFDLDDYVEDVDNPDSEINWSFTGNVHINVEIEPETHLAILTPESNWYGREEITFQATDPGPLSDSFVQGVVVNPVNDSPWIEPPVPDLSADEDNNIVIDLTPYENDVEDLGTNLDWTVTSYDPSAIKTILGQNSNDDILTFVPVENYFGTTAVTLRLTDSGGLYTEQEISLTWNAVSDSPVLNPIGNQTIDEGQVLEFTVTAEDPDTGDIVTISVENLSDFCQIIEENPGNPASLTISCQPSFRDAGTDKEEDLIGTYPEIIFTASDNTSPPLSDSETITIFVNNISIFTDTGPGTPGYWAFKEIEALYNAKIVSGYEDGSYQPEGVVNRAQMAVFISRAIAQGDENVPEGPEEPNFPDVPKDFWAYKYIEYLKEQGVVGGYDDDLYHPEYEVDRAQMAAFISRAIAEGEENIPEGPEEPSFPDVPKDSWAYKYIEYLKERGIVSGYDDNLYHPEFEVDRGQMAVFIYRAFLESS